MIYVASKKRKLESIEKEYPNAIILDITSSSPHRYGQLLSPFYPHGNIPIPGDSRGMTATCVEAVWQGLKVFEHCGIDTSIFKNDSMKGIKRTVRKYGKPVGHQYGVFSNRILGYQDAKLLIYLPTYKYVLEHYPAVQHIIQRITEKAKTDDIVLLDYNINPENRDASKPLSHAELVRLYIEGRYPENAEDIKPFTPEELKEIKAKRKQRNLKTRKGISAMSDPAVRSAIISILKDSSRSIKEINDLASLTWPSKKMKAYLLDIPGMRVEKIKRIEYFTLMPLEKTATLF